MAGLIKPGQESRIDSFPGMDNTSAETTVVVRDALNVDFDSANKFQMRAGRSKRLALTDPSSLFADREFPYMLARVGSQLLAFDDTLQGTVVATGLGDAPASYVQLNGEILWTVEGVRTGCLDMLLRTRGLGLPTPSGIPTLAAGSNGGLAAGDYQLALSYLDTLGEESGSCPPAVVTVADNGSIALGLPVPDGADAHWVRLYASEANGTSLYHVIDLPAGTTTYTLREGDRGDELRTPGLQPLPAGHIVRESNGILWMAVDNCVVYGEALRPRLYHPARNFIPYNARVDMIEPVGDAAEAGVFVGAGSRVYFHAGGVPRTVNMKQARMFGAVPGTSCRIPGELVGEAFEAVAYWMGKDGAPCIGLPGGRVRVLAKRVAMTQFERGATLLREVDGKRQLITSGPRGAVAAFAAGDSVEVFQYRNGIPVP